MSTSLKERMRTYAEKQFIHRKVATAVTFIIGTLYVFTPHAFAVYVLIAFIGAVSIQSILYFPLFYLKIGRTCRRIKMRHSFRNYKIEELEPSLQQILYRWSSKLKKGWTVQITDSIMNVETKVTEHKIRVNPNYIRTADSEEAEASFYHELGHAVRVRRYYMHMALVGAIMVFYFLITSNMVGSRLDAAIIRFIAFLCLTRLLLVWLFWWNEYRADRYAMQNTNLQSMKKMFDSMKLHADAWSHPSPDRRWKKVQE